MLGSLIAGISIPYLIPSVIDLTDNINWKSSQRKLQRAGILQKDTKIRISFAYLFRIKVDGQYFLVPNKRSQKFQPVGGAYKLTKAEANYLGNNIPVEDDDRIPIDETTRFDYRLFVKNKDLRKFVRRFNKTEQRENIGNLFREFNEELFLTGIIEKEKFGKLKYKYIGRHMSNVKYGNIFKCYELLLADIVEVDLSNNQEQMFRDLMSVKSEKYLFANSDKINSLGVTSGTNNLADIIANHTPKILSENQDKLIMRNKHNSIYEI